MRFILRIMLVALVAFEGCKDTKKEENKNPPAAGGETPNGDANGAGKQDQIAPDQNNPKQPKKLSNPAGAQFKPAEAKVTVKTASGDKEVMIKGSVFTGKGKDGDFASMIGKAGNEKTLFVFNDDEAAFDDFKSQLAAPSFDNASVGCKAGTGNAVIRPEQCKTSQRAAGVPVGKTSSAAYADLTQGKTKIGEAINSIRKLVTEKDYTTVIFSQAPNADTISTGKLTVPDEVKKYIYDSLLALEANA